MVPPPSHIVVVSALPPNRGRLSEYGRQLVEGLARDGWRLRVLSDMKGDGGPHNPAIHVEPAWSPDRPHSLLRIPIASLRGRGRLVLFNVHFAVFGRGRLANFLGFASILLTALLGRLTRHRTMVILHNLPDTMDTRCFGLKPSLLNRLGLLLAVRMALACDRVVVTTRLNREAIRRRFGREASYIPHGAWSLGGSPSSADGRRDSLLFLGYLAPNKDMGLLAAVYRRLRGRHGWLKLKLVTSPHPNFPEAIRQLEAIRGVEGVEHLGYVGDEGLPAILSTCFAAVLPYRTATGTSGVLHLVSASGLPVVATDLPSFREEREAGAGLILARGVEEMVEALDRLITDQDYWLYYSERSRRFGEERSWERVVAAFRDLIVETVGR